MNKIIFLFILLVVPAPFADAHPDPNSAMLMQNGIEIKNVEFIGLIYEEEEVEFLSEEWFWKNFILLLSGLIAAIIVVTCVLVYKEEV